MITRDTTKKILKIFAFLIVSIGIVGYIFFAFRDYISGPEIIVLEPINGSVSHNQIITVKGQGLRIKDISLNNRPLLIDEEGHFKEDLLLFPGYNIALLTAIDRFGRTIEYKLELVYED
jgi:hypothetical protein